MFSSTCSTPARTARAGALGLGVQAGAPSLVPGRRCGASLHSSLLLLLLLPLSSCLLLSCSSSSPASSSPSSRRWGRGDWAPGATPEVGVTGGAAGTSPRGGPGVPDILWAISPRVSLKEGYQ